MNSPVKVIGSCTLVSVTGRLDSTTRQAKQPLLLLLTPYPYCRGPSLRSPGYLLDRFGPNSAVVGVHL